jgi:hypothetical protein
MNDEAASDNGIWSSSSFRQFFVKLKGPHLNPLPEGEADALALFVIEHLSFLRHSCFIIFSSIHHS